MSASPADSSRARAMSAPHRDAPEYIPFGARKPFRPVDAVEHSRGQRRSKRQSTMRDSTHASREGRHFRVGNIGNNGMLYLRPVGPQHRPQASTSTAYSPTRDVRELPSPEASWRDSVTSGTGTFQSTGSRNSFTGVERSTLTSSALLKRSHSFSNSRDSIPQTGLEQGPFKVVVDRASVRKDEPASSNAPQLLKVQIPHYKLGRPKFGRTGSAAMQSSLYSSEADQVSSHGHSTYTRTRVSRGLDYLDTSIGSSHGSFASENRNMSPTQRRTISSELLPLGLPRSADTGRGSGPSWHSVGTDQNAIMRVSSTGQLLAATPTILINQMTSPTNLDYDLLSDFFLTFRFYTTATNILASLLSRLSSAMSSSQECGRVVRVRAFVALRHWVLNYFIDDFVPDFALRARLCGAVNNICHELLARRDGGGGDLNIMGELKKCWRRTCSLYWDVPEHRLESPGDDIMPGGKIGSRNSSLGGNMEGATGLDTAPLLSGEVLPKESPWIVPTQNDKVPTRLARSGSEQDQRTSLQSTHVISCSIPIHQRSKAPPSSYAPRPVTHRRSGSFSDALRDGRAPPRASQVYQQDVTDAAFQPLPGSVIRGAVFQPPRPDVETVAPSSPSEELASFEFNYRSSEEADSGDERANAAGNPAVRKIFGSMRRALSARQPRAQSMARPPPERYRRRLSNGPSGRTTRTPSPRGVARRKIVAGRTVLRTDLLAARVGESFDKAVREEMDAQYEEPQDQVLVAATQGSSNRLHPRLFAHPESDDARAQSNVTMGSRSIVIVDDTGEKTPTAATFAAMTNARAVSTDHGSSASPNPGSQNIPVTLDLSNSPDTGLIFPDRAVSARYGEPKSSTVGNSHFADPIQGATPSSQRETFMSDDSGTLPVETNAKELEDRVKEESARHQTPSTLAGETAVAEDSNSMTTAAQSDRGTKPGLRRMPGGNLRAVDHVHELKDDSGTDSYGSYQGEIVTATATPLRIGTNPAEANENTQDRAATASRKSISMFATHSSQPNMRPSFEREVAKLAEMPDSPEDGGIESTLLKLEGRTSDSQVTGLQTSPRSRPDEYDLSVDPEEAEALDLRNDSRKDRNQPEETLFSVRSRRGEQSQSQLPRQSHLAGPRATTVSVAPTEISMSATAPDRGSSDTRKRISSGSSDWLEVSLPRSQENMNSNAKVDTRSGDINTSDQSLDVIDPTASMLRIPPGATMPTNAQRGHESFLLDDNQSLDSLSEDDDHNPSRGITSFFEDDDEVKDGNTYQTTPSGGFAPNAGVIDGIGVAMTTPGPAVVYEHDIHPFRRAPANETTRNDGLKTVPSKSKSAGELRGKRPPISPPPVAAHLPFILSYKSSLIAQQLTLIEKDALCEIDWRELIELRWKQTACPIRNWVDFLRSNRSPSGKPIRNGVDLCIARFNLVVKWAVSQIVLTQDIHERVACIVKFIHIAQHARQLRNWATMYQISTALVSAESSRLKQTWSRVPDKEIQALKTLEALIMPMRNFNNLRGEMEAALAADADNESNGACIPFIGIYTHDLIYNAQKPPFIGGYDGRDGGEPLVNFERHHTAATIAKSLLQMLEASMRYPFKPVPEVLGRCLWLAALSDEEITRRSHQLEP